MLGTLFEIQEMIHMMNSQDVVFTEAEIDQIRHLKVEVIDADRIVFCYGLHTNLNSTQNITNFSLEMDRNLIKVEQSSMKTSENGCYAVGDAVSYSGKMKGILSCCYEAQTAVTAISKEFKKSV